LGDCFSQLKIVPKQSCKIHMSRDHDLNLIECLLISKNRRCICTRSKDNTLCNDCHLHEVLLADPLAPLPLPRRPWPPADNAWRSSVCSTFLWLRYSSIVEVHCLQASPEAGAPRDNRNFRTFRKNYHDSSIDREFKIPMYRRVFHVATNRLPGMTYDAGNDWLRF